MNKSGYLYVYVSNETPNIHVFFDKLQVTHVKGPVVEETHYYPFGLTMEGISSKAAGIITNKEQTFQNQRFDDEFDLNWVQFKWRNHDPQIGRFIEIDPLANDYVYNSTYAFSENKVVGHLELEGLESIEANAIRAALLYIKNGADIFKGNIVEKAKVQTREYNNLPRQIQETKGLVADVGIISGIAQMVHLPLETTLTIASLALGGEMPAYEVAVAITGVGFKSSVSLSKNVVELGVVNSIEKNAKSLVTEKMITESLEGSSLKTIQDGVSLPAVQRYVNMLESGSTSLAIKVANGVIVDENHRYIAGRIFGVEPLQVPGALPSSQAPNIKPIQQIKISPIDWLNF